MDKQIGKMKIIQQINTKTNKQIKDYKGLNAWGINTLS